MNTPEIILHHYDASPFSQKALKMLAAKGLAWRSVVMPMIAPKPDLVALTGGYRGTPVLQLGADIYVDTIRIAAELEARFPSRPLFPGGSQGLMMTLTPWADHFFEAGLHMAIHDLEASWDDAFRADRAAVFERLDFSEVKSQFAEACASLRAEAALIDQQLSDGRGYLLGEEPSLADIHAWPVFWFTRAAIPATSALLAGFENLPAWEARMAGLGEGQRLEATAAEAHGVARGSTPQSSPSPTPAIDPADPLGLKSGESVAVEPRSSKRGGSKGKLIGLDPKEITIEVTSPEAGRTHVHFPRHGYSVKRAG